MYIKKSYPLNQLRDYSMLFSRSEVSRLFDNDFNSLNLKIKRYDNRESIKKLNYLDYLKYAYKVLETHYPNEYVYKNEFLNQWLIKEVGNCQQSAIYNEFRLGKAIADLVMFNGTSKVFEIKTILDKEYRLSKQLIEYKKVFNEVYLIVPKLKLFKYLNIDDEVGIIVYDEDKKEFELIRNSYKNHFLNHSAIMEILHTSEYLNLVENYYGYLPKVNDFNKFDICKKLISEIPGFELNRLFIDLMKSRKKQNNFSRKETRQFNQICLSLNLNKVQKQELFTNLKQQINY
ncbi:sce7726 family protein [Flavobacterium salilacus subsp. salilacus]|uniref:sce7726 family protein n=1 Tax=Flavobacterium TaxID=237 RepID=UPI001074E830|nr:MULTISPECIES: sce7726 family protein [Flavobacterium]KAF2518184.1 sce7726 family protein [Flavobacterium salilacus subsp. salilacus]MBE1615504.1 sce7726 family protein [Flavobacterium sp. SaA2.13]